MATRDEYIAKANKAKELGDAELELAYLKKAKDLSAQNIDTKSYANPASRFTMGVLDPALGTGQMIVHGLSAVAPEGSAMSKWAGESDKSIEGLNKKMELAREKENVGFDLARFAGNVVSPVNSLFLTKAAPVTAAGKVLQGAGVGAASGAMQPTEGGDDYWTNKAAQAGLGGAVGGAMAGVTSKISDKLARGIAKTPEDTLATQAVSQTDEAVNAAMQDLGPNAAKIPLPIIEDIKKQVFEGFKKGEKIDAAAALRNIDFEKLGIKPLQGQITRDPLQYSAEKNLRGAIPEIATHLQGQEAGLRNKMAGLAGTPTENYQAGAKAIDTLKAYDQAKRANIGNLYTQAKESAGKDYVIPTEQLFKDIAAIKNDYRHSIPKGLLKTIDEYQGGVISGAERVPKPFTFEEADHLLKLVNESAYGAPSPTTSAANKIKGAIKTAIESADDTGGVYAPAVKAAADRFKQMDEIPALGAVYRDAVAPDDFAKKFILSGKTDEVKAMAKLLKENDPAAFEQAKYQIGSQIQRAMTGENIVGDSGTSGNSLAKLLRTYGDEKLSAFYSPEEIETLHRLSRVSGYINTPPAANVQNFSNTTTAALSQLPVIHGLLSNLGPVGRVAEGAVKAGTGAVKNNMAASRALNAQVPISQLPMTAQQRKLLSLISVLPPIAGGAAAGNVFNQ